MRRELLDELLAARAAKRPVVLATRLDTGEQRLLGDDDPTARRALVDDESRVEDGVFLHVFNPPLRMVIVGAVHIAQALAQMAAAAGFEVTIVDPRRAFATTERFPGVALATVWPGPALAELRPDRRTAVVTLTHDPKLDDPALAAALRSPAFYIGALGSKKTHGARCQRLADEGFDAAALARIHGPVGLAIGARSTAEIAVSILAQVVQVLRG